MRLFKRQGKRRSLLWFTPGRVLCLLGTGIGCVLVGFGVSYGSGWLTAIGGAVLGTCLASLVTIGDIRSLLQETLSSGFLTQDEELNPFREVWHHYHVTQIDEQFVWRHYTLDLSGTQAVGTLVSSVSFEDKQSEPRAYAVEAGARGDRLVLFMQAKDHAEPPVVEVFPQTAGFMDKLFGFGCLQSWDTAHLLHQCILSKNPLYSAEADGNVPDEQAQQLDILWKEEFAKHNLVLPSPRRSR